jgi:acetyl-CoA carboxylase biotin carboxylase subunit
MFDKILIANRGEIAVRIIRACQELGIRTVAVYSEADAAALYTRLADEAVLIGPASPTASYLRGDQILKVAQQSHCQAIHPGYGFLAENAGFAEAVIAAGLAFIGPDPEAIRLMGSKTSARTAMQTAQVPVIPGYQASQADEDLLAAAGQIGYPVLVKATAGGGGKGMRSVQSPADLPQALASARREARNAFGDDRIYLEKCLENPRHIEFQVFGDQAGQVMHLFERECSIQRRHQKIIEETPSPLLIQNETLREQMGEAAIAAARAINYVNAGTIEFLVDAGHNFYFLEMNTRLQVEHPITELVVGVDLVKWQLRVAAGEPLPCRQADLSQRGHAIECRLYAEDPANEFLPSVGQIIHLVEPVGPGVRIDSGITHGDEVTVHYDPLLAKLITHGEDRQEAIRKMDWALRHYAILGEVTTNIAFLRDVLGHVAFQRGEITTDFVEHAFSNWQPAEAESSDLALVAAAVADVLDGASRAQAGSEMQGRGATNDDPYSPWGQYHGFRLGQSIGRD